MSILSTASKKFNFLRGALVAALVVAINAAAAAPAAAGVTNLCGNAQVSSPSDFCSENLEYLGNGLAWYALAAAIVGIFISATLWALGSKGQNPGQELTGKRGLIVCLAAAFCVGGAVPMMNKIQSYANEIESSPGASAPADPAQNGCLIRQDCPTTGGGGTASGLNR